MSRVEAHFSTGCHFQLHVCLDLLHLASSESNNVAASFWRISQTSRNLVGTRCPLQREYTGWSFNNINNLVLINTTLQQKFHFQLHPIGLHSTFRRNLLNCLDWFFRRYLFKEICTSNYHTLCHRQVYRVDTTCVWCLYHDTVQQKKVHVFGLVLIHPRSGRQIKT